MSDFYNVNENRKVIKGYLIEQDSQGNIHIFKTGSMEYIDFIDNVGIMPNDVFIDWCKEWTDNK